MNQEFEQLIQMEIDGQLDEAGRARLRQLAADDPRLATRLRQERRLSGLLARCGPNFAPAGLARAVFAKLDAVVAPLLSRRMNIGRALRATSNAGHPRRFWEIPSLHWVFGLGIFALVSMQIFLFVRQLQGDPSRQSLASFVPRAFQGDEARQLAQLPSGLPAGQSSAMTAIEPAPLSPNAPGEEPAAQVIAGDLAAESAAEVPDGHGESLSFYLKSFNGMAPTAASQRSAMVQSPPPAAQPAAAPATPAPTTDKAASAPAVTASADLGLEPQVTMAVSLAPVGGTTARPHTRRDVEIAIAMAGGRILSTAPAPSDGQWSVQCVLTREQASAFMAAMQRKGIVADKERGEQQGSSYQVTAGQKLLTTAKTNPAPLLVRVLIQ